MESQKFIVAEISVNWISGKLFDPAAGLIGQRFERVIETNHQRGYALHSFTLHRLDHSATEMNETIIAVFTET